jgi:hypothetical protein
LSASWSISRQRVKSAAEPTAGTQNRRTEAYTRFFSVPSRTWRLNFAAQKNNACEIREDFRRRSNALHHPVIYRSVKLLHRTVAYPAVLYVLMPDDEADRVLLRTGHHERKSERICGMSDFSPQGVHSSLTQKPISRKYGGEKLMKSKLRNEIKSYIVRQGMTMQEVVDLLRDEHGWSDSVSNLSNKLQRESLRYVETVQLADALGYEIVWQRRK